MIYHFKSLVLVRKGRAFYLTLYQEVFYGNPGGGGSLRKQNVHIIEIPGVRVCVGNIEGPQRVISIMCA